ncbi:hypothetical protein EDD86DRAFT_211951 [Gorgonomyces haynaldii]|nr:hypothetical protein EDD86DRAFT_211951 [Gorgonomyces haynaldii]
MPRKKSHDHQHKSNRNSLSEMPKYNEERVLKNRQAAQASRDRKKQQFEFLVRENQRLQEQNQALEARLAALESTNQTLLACLTPIHMPSPPMDSLFDFTTPLPAQPVLLSKFPTDPTEEGNKAAAQGVELESLFPEAHCFQTEATQATLCWEDLLDCKFQGIST